MKNLLKLSAVSTLVLISINAFAASQQAEELKKFTTWAEQTESTMSSALDAVVTKVGGMDAAGAEAASAEFNKTRDAHFAELDALSIKSEEIKPLVAKYKEKVQADADVVAASVAFAKEPKPELQAKMTEATNKMQEADKAFSELEDKLGEQFPEE